ncbi:MAG TPA: hypothetical protein VFQ53_05025 [Kofleriaceae bacterium]|nr:hypothetical protein [Kofleriaceae bacterium]
MAVPKTPDPSSRSSREIHLGRPRWSFWKGLLTGAAIEIPLIAVTVFVLGRVGLAGNPTAGFMHIMRLTTVFAGTAALLTAGGIGRLAAYATVERGRRHAILAAARAHAAAGAGLVIIAIIPQRHLPTEASAWVAIAAVGLIPGAICGGVIGFICSGQSTVNLSDVWSLAAKPSEALRQLLDPKDLVRLGAALSERTTKLFEGIFDPAPPPPKQPAPPSEPSPPSSVAPPSEPPVTSGKETKDA